MKARKTMFIGVAICVLTSGGCGGKESKTCDREQFLSAGLQASAFLLAPEDLYSLFLPSKLADSKYPHKFSEALDCNEWSFVKSGPWAPEAERKHTMLRGYGYTTCTELEFEGDWKRTAEVALEGPNIYGFEHEYSGLPGSRTSSTLKFIEIHGDYSRGYMLNARLVLGPDDCETVLLVGAYESEAPDESQIEELLTKMGCRGR